MPESPGNGLELFSREQYRAILEVAGARGDMLAAAASRLVRVLLAQEPIPAGAVHAPRFQRDVIHFAATFVHQLVTSEPAEVGTALGADGGHGVHGGAGAGRDDEPARATVPGGRPA